MAKFDQSGDATKDPSYLGYSQGTSNASLANIPQIRDAFVPTPPNFKANETGAAVAKGIGDVLTLGVKATDEVIKETISEDLHKGLDKIRDEFGVAEASTRASQGPLDITKIQTEPAAIKKLGNQLDGLKEAWQQGTLPSDSYYWARAEAFVRQTAAQYPGYREVIDEKVSTILGTTPANALRKSLQSDVTELQKKMQSSADHYQSFLQTHAQDLPKDFWVRQSGGSEQPAYSRMEVYNYVAQRQGKRRDYEDGRLKIGLSKELGELDVKEAESAAIKETALTVQTQISDMAEAGGGIGGILKKIQDKQAAKENFSPDEIKEITQAFSLQKQRMELTLHNQLSTQPMSPGSTDTYASIIRNPEMIKKIVAEAMRPYDVVAQAIKDDHWGIVHVYANHAKLLQDKGMYEVMSASNFGPKLAAMQKVLGNEAFNTMMTQSNGLVLKSTFQWIHQLGLAEITTNTNTIENIFDRAKKEKIKDPNFYRSQLDDAAKVLTEATVPVTAKENAVKSLFSPTADGSWTGLMLKIEPNERIDAFTRLASPEVQKSVEALGPQAKLMHNEWVKQNFAVIYKDRADQLNQIMANNDYYGKLNYDPDTHLLTVSNKRGVSVRSDSVDQMNRALKLLDPVIKSEGGDFNKALPEILSTMGMKPQIGKAPAEAGGFLESILSPIKEGLAKSVEGVSKKIEEKRPTFERGQGKPQDRVPALPSRIYQPGQ